MIIKSFELRRKNLNKIKYFLLYGNNQGLIEETFQKIIKPNKTKNIYNYDENEIIKNIDNFEETISTKSFFENDKLILINRATDKIFKIIQEIINRDIDDISIVLISGVLEKKSKMRNFFEKNKNTVTIPFYEDNYQTLNLFTCNFLKEKKISLSPQNINLIIERSKGNRISLKNELKKIESFSLKKPSVELSDILKLTNLAENYNVSELTDQCLAGNKKKTLNILNENNPSPEDNILILKTFLYKLKRLKKLKLELEIKKNADSVISSYKPAIFWKDKEMVKQQLKIWSMSEIKSLINKTNKMELLIKKNSQISNQLINNFILEKL